jgi:hypothetical protein
MWGLRNCGFSAVYGLPKVDWTLKWFTSGGSAVALAELPGEAGQCAAGAPPGWTEPDAIPHTGQQVECPIHGVKH